LKPEQIQEAKLSVIEKTDSWVSLLCYWYHKHLYLQTSTSQLTCQIKERTDISSETVADKLQMDLWNSSTM